MNRSRRFIDSEGFSWQVYELQRAADDVAPSSSAPGSDVGWLYFFSREITRSLSPYPRDWIDLSWPALENLCRRATVPLPRPSAVGAGASLEARL